MELSERRVLRASLIALWLGTGLVSLWEWRGQSTQLLLQAGLAQAAWRDALIGAGSLLDLLLGAVLWRYHRKRVYLVAGLAMAGMTLLASVILPTLWLHPLGPLLKNLPVAALLWLLHRDAPA